MTHDQAIERLNASVRNAVEYAGTESMNAARRMLEDLAEVYRHDLINVPPEQLVFRQAVAKQVIALSQVFAGNVNADPRI